VIADLVLYLVGSVIVAMLVTLVAASTARLRIEQAFRFYWTWGALAAVAAFASAILL
jgi:formate hydrogenlyase subunit 4